MVMSDLEKLRYPIGRFAASDDAGPKHVAAWIDDIERLPAALASAVETLTEKQLDTPYRPEGWTVRRLVHHVADSHLNAYARFKLAATEDNPTIKAYDQDLWANLEDANGPVAVSLDLLAALHKRWVVFLRSLDSNDVTRSFVHPESGPMKVSDLLQLYSWHGRHHVAHIQRLIDRQGWGSG
ncbi:MAG: putative metal-dependent hydrolase [Rhodothermales bacterium]|nr:putative metal-dependent hydrolase [Rhodothermales bacterium]